MNPLTKLRHSLREPGELWRSAGPGSRLMLLAGVFFLFAIVGVLGDAPAVVQHGAWTQAVLIGLFAGLVSVAYVWAIAAAPRWFPAVVAVQIALTAFFSTYEPTGLPLVAAGPAARLLEHRLAIVSGLVIACVSISWAFLLSFVTRGGKRYVALATELSLARRIHQTLVPPVERGIGGFEFLAVSLPSGDVGGDLVDVVEHHDAPGWTAYLVDVSGHGVPSGVLMGMVKSAVRVALTRPEPLERMLVGLNDVLCDLSQPQMFATFAALRPAGPGRLAFILAGHLPILRWRAATGVVERLSIAQLPLGMMPDREYAAADSASEPGDVFLLLTDGLTEVFDRADRELGLDGIAACLAAHARAPLASIRDAIVAAARAHGPQTDDQSLVLVRAEEEGE